MKPQSVYFCNAYPLTEKDFLAGSGKDFIQLYEELKSQLSEPFSWCEYEREIVIPYKMFKDCFKSYGINFLENFTIENFQHLIKSEQQELIVLFTHCKDGGMSTERIEFFDGLCDSDKVLSYIPPGCDSILDLGVCNPQYLATKIRIFRPGCVTRYAETSISIVLWILFYAELLKNMLTSENYFTSYEQAVYKFWRK